MFWGGVRSVWPRRWLWPDRKKQTTADWCLLMEVSDIYRWMMDCGWSRTAPSVNGGCSSVIHIHQFYTTREPGVNIDADKLICAVKRHHLTSLHTVNISSQPCSVTFSNRLLETITLRYPDMLDRASSRRLPFFFSDYSVCFRQHVFRHTGTSLYVRFVSMSFSG